MSYLDKLPIIHKHSAHLAGVVNRLLPEESGLLLEYFFKLAINNGGLSELDFSRKAEASYNPRPARVALILLNETKIYDAETLAVAISRSSDTTIQLLEDEDLPILSEKFFELYELSFLSPGELANCKSPHRQLLFGIIGALHLDRARHWHLSAKSSEAVLNQNFLTECEQILALIASDFPNLYLLLEHWIKRQKSKQLPNS